MAAAIAEIVGAFSTVGAEFLAAGSVLSYVVGFAIVGFAWRLVSRAIRR